MSARSDARRIRAKAVLARRNRYQFGQPPRTTTLVDGGKVACTDTCIQLIALIIHGRKVSLNKVRTLSRGPTDGSRGLRPSEALRALRALGLPYTVRTDLSVGEALRIVRNRGPIIIAEAYWAHPEWQGYRYAGELADGYGRNSKGRRVHIGYAKPRGAAGKTQLRGFSLGHAVLLAWTDDAMRIGGVRDSNHNSLVRRERPRWDKLERWQLRRMFDSIKPLYGGKRLLYVPTRRL